MLEKIQQLINHDGKIYGPYNDSQVQLQISCKEHLLFLTQSWGLDNNKSHNLKWKQPPEEFLPHLVRGYMDGDGSIYTKQSNNPNVNTIGLNFVGTHHFIDGLQKAINEANNLPVTTGCISDLDTYASLVYNGNNIALKILDWIYLDSTELTRLDRKFERYIEYKKYIKTLTNYNENNKSIKYIATIIPDYKLSQQIRFDHQYFEYTIQQLSKKYKVNASVIDGIIKNITHTKSDNRTNHAKIYIEAFGENKHILDWVNDDRCVVDLGTLRDRVLNQKLSPEEALTKLSDSTSGILKYKYDIDGEEKTISELLSNKGISRSTFIYRVFELGMDPKEASEKAAGEIPRNQSQTPNNSHINQVIANEMRIKYASGKTIKSLTEEYNVTSSLVYDVVQNRSWVDISYTHTKSKSDTIQITHNSESKTIQQWADELNIPYAAIDRRYREFQSGKIKSIDDVLTQNKLPKTKSNKSEKDRASDDLAKSLREDYKNGLQGKELYEKYSIKKSRYIDIIGNRTNKENHIWWKN